MKKVLNLNSFGSPKTNLIQPLLGCTTSKNLCNECHLVTKTENSEEMNNSSNYSSCNEYLESKFAINQVEMPVDPEREKLTSKDLIFKKKNSNFLQELIESQNCSTNSQIKIKQPQIEKQPSQSTLKEKETFLNIKQVRLSKKSNINSNVTTTTSTLAQLSTSKQQKPINNIVKSNSDKTNKLINDQSNELKKISFYNSKLILSSRNQKSQSNLKQSQTQAFFKKIIHEKKQNEKFSNLILHQILHQPKNEGCYGISTQKNKDEDVGLQSDYVKYVFPEQKKLVKQGNFKQQMPIFQENSKKINLQQQTLQHHHQHRTLQMTIANEQVEFIGNTHLTQPGNMNDDQFSNQIGKNYFCIYNYSLGKRKTPQKSNFSQFSSNSSQLQLKNQKNQFQERFSLYFEDGNKSSQSGVINFLTQRHTHQF